MFVSNVVHTPETYRHGVKARKLAYCGHTTGGLEKEIMQGTMPGARRRGRPRTAWMDNIKTWTDMTHRGRVNQRKIEKVRSIVHSVANVNVNVNSRFI